MSLECTAVPARKSRELHRGNGLAPPAVVVCSSAWGFDYPQGPANASGSQANGARERAGSVPLTCLGRNRFGRGAPFGRYVWLLRLRSDLYLEGRHEMPARLWRGSEKSQVSGSSGSSSETRTEPTSLERGNRLARRGWTRTGYTRSLPRHSNRVSLALPDSATQFRAASVD